MGDIKNLNSTAVYAWTTLISVFICVPAALIMEGPRLRLAVDALANSHPNFYMDLFIVGLLYHLYNQVGLFAQSMTAKPCSTTFKPMHNLHIACFQRFPMPYIFRVFSMQPRLQ
jgi:Triose-phosphate Transporter family